MICERSSAGPGPVLSLLITLYDCSIDLLPSTSLPRRQLYTLSAPEHEALKKHLSEFLAAGTIV